MARQDIAKDAEVIAPSDSTVLSPTLGIYVGGAGNLKVDFPNAPGITIIGVLAGSVYPFCVTKVYAATTATNLLALY